MLASTNPEPTLAQFQSLMKNTDLLLNNDAEKRPEYYAKRAGNPLEDDVERALSECAINTPFEGTIVKVSGLKFPDIVANKFYGVEVKSTKEDHWRSTGSSILENTRIEGVERIYMTFGKLGGKPAFLSRPYEDVLYDIAVTHMPRYLINMQLKPNETIFSKMHIPYDTLRKMDDPITPVSAYYRNHLKPGERLWWTGDKADEVVSAAIRLWRTLTADEKRVYVAYALVNFPEVFGGDYDAYALWLTSQGVVDPHIRDQFSAGGQEDIRLATGEIAKFPGSYRRLKTCRSLIVSRFMTADPSQFVPDGTLATADEIDQRMYQWKKAISQNSPVPFEKSMAALNVIFP